jgi:hypothetical protein
MAVHTLLMARISNMIFHEEGNRTILNKNLETTHILDPASVAEKAPRRISVHDRRFRYRLPIGQRNKRANAGSTGASR